MNRRRFLNFVSSVFTLQALALNRIEEHPDNVSATHIRAELVMPFFPDHVLDEIRNSVNIVTFISESVALKKRGRNHVACCPFHNEKTPSFNVNAEKQIFMCFGCGVGGDVFKFAMLVEHVTFREAVRLLAERCSIPLPQVERAGDASSGVDLEALRGAMADAASSRSH